MRDGLTMITFTPNIQYYEDWQGAHTLGIGVPTFLEQLKEAGLGTLLGNRCTL